MSQPIKSAFGHKVMMLPLVRILPVRQVSDEVKQTLKYKRIVASIAEVGIVEPLVVANEKTSDHYMLLDGHLRYTVLRDGGAQEAPCLMADDDEAFTYNKRVNRLATVQEHYMIVRAIERGVSVEKVAKKQNVDIRVIQKKR